MSRAQVGGCVPMSKLCDLVVDCTDGSDELVCEKVECGDKKTDNEFACTNGQCIPA